MKNLFVLSNLLPLAIVFTFLGCDSGSNKEEKSNYKAGVNNNSPDKQDSVKQDNQNTELIKDFVESKKKPILDFKQLYPILKNDLLKQVCESYKIEEEKNSLSALSKETDMFLSLWEWDFINSPLVIKDIDNDGLTDYTIELLNQGGGCGGQIGQSERWTLFGVKPDRFVWTHIIPYRSQSGNWEKI